MEARAYMLHGLAGLQPVRPSYILSQGKGLDKCKSSGIILPKEKRLV
jgi:hypothetical protein